MKEEDRPIWYDVVKAFPPLPKPPPKHTIPNILYPEDFVRVHFCNQYTDPGATRLSDEKFKSVQQRFVDKYLELHEDKSAPPGKLFENTVAILREEGIRFITHEEKKATEQVQVNNRNVQKESWKKDKQAELEYHADPFTANTTTITSKSGKPQTKETSTPTLSIDSLFEEPR